MLAYTWDYIEKETEVIYEHNDIRYLLIFLGGLVAFDSCNENVEDKVDIFKNPLDQFSFYLVELIGL